MYKDFEDYLKDEHAKEYTGTDDDMPDDYDKWLGDLDGEEYIKYADLYAVEVRRGAYEKGYDKGHTDGYETASGGM